MPRTARKKSKSGIYHIMLRGANRQEIFHDEKDHVKFLEILERYKMKSEMKVYAWCLMGNHVHLLVKEGNEALAITMKRIGVSYVSFYNWKYRTTGHLFQDRYRSENVESDRYLFAVIRYIHQNPVKVGLVKKPESWNWSSCQAYYGKECDPLFLLDSDFILGIFSENRKEGMRRFKEYNEMENKDKFMDDEENRRLSDEEAGKRIGAVVKGYEIASIKSLPKLQRDEIVYKIKKIEGITQRQIARILGISLSLINRA